MAKFQQLTKQLPPIPAAPRYARSSHQSNLKCHSIANSPISLGPKALPSTFNISLSSEN